MAKRVLSIFILAQWMMLAICANAQNLTVLHTFTNSPDGASPYIGGGMVLSSNTLYGTTSVGGGSSNGTIFTLNTDGTGYGIIYNFTGGTNGAIPGSGLIISSNTLYGTALRGGSNGCGVVFSLNIGNTNFTALHIFTTSSPSMNSEIVGAGTLVTNSDGACPFGQLLLVSNRLYGTTPLGGINGSGTVFSMNPDGSDFEVLHSFAPGVGTNADGLYSTAGLVFQNGILSGTTSAGGTNKNGVVFTLNTKGSNFSVLHTFAATTFPFFLSPDGRWPSGLVISSNTIYGITASGGSNGGGTIFSINPDGSDFTVIHNLSGSDGSPSLSQLSALGNKLYGAASQNALYRGGSVFSLNTDGSDFAVLYNFSGNNGTYNTSSLVLSGNTVYGTPQEGGSAGYGTVFSLQLPVSFSRIVANPNGSTTLSLMGTPYLSYLEQATTNLLSPISWETIGTNTAGADGSWQFTDTNASNFHNQFYRSVLLFP